MILQRLQECGLKLSPKKCLLSRTRVMYVGHIASEHGIEPDPHKIDKVTHWPTPTCPEDVRTFLGFAGYYRKFIHGFSKIARPLTDVMPAPHMSKRKTETRDTTNMEMGRETGQRLSTPPILAYPDYSKPFEL